LEKNYKMEFNKLTEIIKSPKDFSNKDLEESLKFLSDNFEDTKFRIINLTKVLDFTEINYNKLLEEYKKRNL